jgi:cell division protein FtsZ
MDINNYVYRIPEAPGAPEHCDIRIIGMGGAGANLIQHMIGAGFSEKDLVILNTDVAGPEASGCAEKLLLGAKRTRGLGIGGDPELARLVAEEEAVRIRVLCEKVDLIYLVAGLGGGTGTGVAPVVARIAKEAGARVLAFVTMPFECEGLRRQRQAQAGLRRLRIVADGVICLSNQKALKLADEPTNLPETFKVTNRLLAQMVQSVKQILSSPGFIKISFADLCSVLHGTQAESFFAAAEAAGEGRSREVVDKLFTHPLLDSGRVLGDADAVLVSFIGGNDLTMTEINRVMEQIFRHCEKARLIMGAAIEASFGERLAVTIIASQRNETDSGSVSSMVAGTSHGGTNNLSSNSGRESGSQVRNETAGRSPSRFVGPPPDLSPEKTRELLQKQKCLSSRQRRSAGKMRQEYLPLEVVSKGRFDKSEPTIHQGEDLDIPTYVRRGVALN